MDHYILDANIFFNMQAGLDLGNRKEEVVHNMTAGISVLQEKKKAQFYMPPRIVDEFTSFFEEEQPDVVKRFLATITVKSPNTQPMNIHASVFYRLVEDIRARSYRGMNIAEEEIVKAGKEFSGKPTLPQVEFQKSVGNIITHFRQRYRQATRTGFIDSLGDLDIIMLAKELDGFVVTTDEGVKEWNRTFGGKESLIPQFGNLIWSKINRDNHI